MLEIVAPGRRLRVEMPEIERMIGAAYQRPVGDRGAIIEPEGPGLPSGQRRAAKRNGRRRTGEAAAARQAEPVLVCAETGSEVVIALAIVERERTVADDELRKRPTAALAAA